MAAGLAWGARGQTALPYAYDYDELFTWMQAGNEEGRVKGVGLWYDGTMMTAHEKDDGVGNSAVLISFFEPGDTSPSFTPYEVSGFPTLSTVLANDLGGTDPEHEVHFGTGSAAYPVCYVVGQFWTYPAPTDLYVFDNEEEEGSAGCEYDARWQAWVVRADHTDSPAKDLYTNNMNPRVFCSDTGVAALCVDVGFDREAGGTDEPLPILVVGGWFEGDTYFETQNYGCSGYDVLASAAGDRDGFLVFLDPHSACLPVRDAIQDPFLLTLGASGETVEVHGVAMDSARYRVIICGSFTGTVDFDPDGSGQNATSNGGSDIFVAAYNYRLGDVACSTRAPFVLDWLWTDGTSGDDVGEKIAVEDGGDVYLAGRVDNGAGGDDVYFARFVAGGVVPKCPSAGTVVSDPEWEVAFECDGESAALDVAIDALGRPVFSGYFEDEITFGSTPHTVTLESEGGFDAFVVRYIPYDETGDPDMIVDWGISCGDEDDDLAQAVAVDPWTSARMAFGGEQAGPGGQGFASSFQPQAVDDPQLIISMVLDSSFSAQHIIGPDVASIIVDSSFVPNGIDENQPVVAIGAVYSNAGHFPLTLGTSSPATVQVIPFTTITPYTSQLIARRLETIDELFHASSTKGMPDGITLAAEALDGFYFPTGTHQDRVGHILVIGNDSDNDDPQGLQDARDAAIALDEVDHIHGLAADIDDGGDDWDRAFLFENVVESDVDFPSGWSSSTLVSPERADLSIAAETTAEFGEPAFLELLSIVMTRLAHCYGDYNTDGVVDSQDLQDFLDDSDPMVEALYADWNFDGMWTGDDNTGLPGNYGVDYSKFVTGYNEGCP